MSVTPGGSCPPSAGAAADHRRKSEDETRAGDESDGGARRSRIWRGERRRAASYVRTIGPTSTEGMVVLDAVHQIQAESANDLAVRWNCKAGKCGSCSAEVNGIAEADVHDPADTSLPLDEPVTIEPMKAFPTDPRPGHRRDLELRGQEEDQALQAAPARRRGRHLALYSQEDVDRVQEFRKCIECFLCQDVCHVLRDHRQAQRVHRPALLRLQPPPSRCTRSTPRTALEELKERQGRRLLQHHQVLHEGLPRVDHDHRQRDHPPQGARRRQALRPPEPPAPRLPLVEGRPATRAGCRQ